MSRRTLYRGLLLTLLVAGVGVYLTAVARPGAPLQYYAAGCVGCHIRQGLELDGPATAALSKGVHPIQVGLSIAPDDTRHAVLRSDQCRSCHTDTHAQWQTSAHGRAFRNEIFQHAFARDQKAWCLNCHAPLWNAQRDGTAVQIAKTPDFDAAYAEGIGCVSCHVREGQIVGLHEPQNNQSQFHPVRVDKGLADGEFCAGCHQFNFVHHLEPFAIYEGDEHPMQNVVREMASTNGALYPDGCVSCHYQAGNHSLKSEGKATLREKLHVKFALEQTNNGERHQLNVHVAMPRLAHHFPTGDLFRILSVVALNRSGAELYRYDFRKEVRVVDRALLQDTTLKPEANEPGASRTLTARLHERPTRCLVEYRLQGAIDSEIEADFHNPEILREIVYDGPCESRQNP